MAVVGIVLSATTQSPVGGAMTLLGLAAAIVGLHRYGRSGAEPLSSLTAEHGDSDVIP